MAAPFYPLVTRYIAPMPGEVSPRSSRFTRIIASLPKSIPFVAPEALERHQGVALRLRLGANESAFGISPRAIAAMRESAAHTNWYADPESYDLRMALTAQTGVGLENIVVGNGIDGLLGYAVRAHVEAGDSVVTSRGTYPTFNYHVTAHGGVIHRVPYRSDRADLEALADTARRTEARLVYLANPDNPSGTWHNRYEIVRLVSELPVTCTLVLDEAYHEFAPEDAIPMFPADQPNIIRMRTFSKAHGMAGARVGYAIADPEAIATIGKFRNQFEVSRVSQAGALASLADPDFVQNVITLVEDGRRDYEMLANQMGLPFIPSATNFVCIDVGGADRAKAVLSGLLELGVFIRMPGEEPLNRCIRVTVGTPEQRAEFADAFKKVWNST